jgi:nucleotide-binding universal stress UspA family protein
MLPSYKKILYATDISPAARQALGHAAALADRFDADVTALHVLPDSLELLSENAGMDLAEHFGEEAVHWIGRGELDQAMRAMHQRLETMLNEDYVHPQTGAHMVNAVVKVVSGDPAEQILSEAAQGGHDLIVMGTHGMGGLLGMVFGSVARETIKNSPVPVMVVPLSGDAEQDK